MSELQTETFYRDEVNPLLRYLRGPIDSFTVVNERELLERATTSGEIPRGAFRNCAVFSDGSDAREQKRYRYEANRAVAILDMLNRREDGPPTLEEQFQTLYIEQTMARAVLVEGARKAIHEQETDHPNPTNMQFYDRSIATSQERLFPRPDRSIADYAMTKVVEKVRSLNGERAEELLREYPFLGVRYEQNTELITEEKRVAWRELLHEKYGPAFAAVRERMGENGLSNATLVWATKLFMEAIDIPMATDENMGGWKVDALGSGYRVDPGITTVHCGARKKEVTWDGFERLMCHEIAGHVTRAENGRMLGYDALQNGLPGNQEPEEGFGLLMENLWAGSAIDTVGREHFRYLTVCYADGFLDGVRHTEEESLRFVSRLIAAQRPNGFDEATLEAARKVGFDHVKRAFRGMPEGVTMYSNLAYLSGKLKIAEFINQSDGSPADILAFLQRGKFNPLDETHINLMHQVE